MRSEAEASVGEDGGSHSGHGHSPNRFAVLSTPERLGDDGALRGRSVTIAFIDSGFQLHPDLTEPENRVLVFHDVWNPARTLERDGVPDSQAWHGTQTSVAAAGNGFLSDGVYRSLAPEARLALVAVGGHGGIGEEAIVRGLQWVLANHERYGIRVVNISLGGDEDRPLAENRINQLTEEAVRRGLILVVAAGNSGCTERHRSRPPATAPSVIAVGGYDDGNDPERRRLALYCSSFGLTADGLVKPEIIAPAMWIAAPILPGTEAYERAETLSRLARTPDHRLRRAVLETDLERLGLASGTEGQSVEVLRAWIDDRLRAEKIVAAHYQHVDGTSFAAPIAASVVAQMLEANPALTPASVKRILLQTADPVGDVPAVRQGYGVLNARAALEAARRESHLETEARSVHGSPGRVVFSFHDDAAGGVSLVGDFNGWDEKATPMRRDANGTWNVALESPAPGIYRYKLVVDGRWISDPGNALREPDPYGGFNSMAIVEG
jgi:serine protease AprX